VKSHKEYQVPEINILGVSQGGLVGRSIVENCGGPKVRNLITVGTPNLGFSEIPEAGCQAFDVS
jgi:triacylglycerol esterase/lipase EstA (alpha/beta hydrolase family)